jgi:hypothetical protein
MTMATITTKFSIGDTVYHAWTTTERKQHPCPDCLGSRKWEAKSPAGRVYQFACPRCGSDYQSERDLCLHYSVFSPAVHCLTIGQVEAHAGGSEAKNKYMCHETGIGSGTVYYEQDLFATEAEAKEAATIKASLNNNTVPWVAEQYNRTLRVCDYQLSDATVKSERDRLAQVRVTLDYLVEDIRGCISIEEVQREIDKFDKTAEVAQAA